MVSGEDCMLSLQSLEESTETLMKFHFHLYLEFAVSDKLEKKVLSNFA